MTELTYLFGVVAVLAGALASISIWRRAAWRSSYLPWAAPRCSC